MIPTGGPGNDEWETPEWVWRPWHSVLHFVIDAACTAENILPVCEWGYTKEDSGLDADWAAKVLELKGGAVWCNPPYSRKGGPIVKWVEKALAESEKGVVSCLLLPSDTSTNWFSLLWNRAEGRWRDGVHGNFTEQRIKFNHPGGKKSGSPTFGSLIAVVSKPLVTPSLKP